MKNALKNAALARAYRDIVAVHPRSLSRRKQPLRSLLPKPAALIPFCGSKTRTARSLWPGCEIRTLARCRFSSTTHYASTRKRLKIAQPEARIPYPSTIGAAISNFWLDATHVRGIWRGCKPQKGCADQRARLDVCYDETHAVEKENRPAEAGRFLWRAGGRAYNLTCSWKNALNGNGFPDPTDSAYAGTYGC